MNPLLSGPWGTGKIARMHSLTSHATWFLTVSYHHIVPASQAAAFRVLPHGAVLLLQLGAGVWTAAAATVKPVSASAADDAKLTDNAEDLRAEKKEGEGGRNHNQYDVSMSDECKCTLYTVY